MPPLYNKNKKKSIEIVFKAVFLFPRLLFPGKKPYNRNIMEQKLTKKELAEFEKLLLGRKKKIEKELEKFAKKDPRLKGDYDTQFPDFGSAQSTDENALEVADYESNLSLEHSLELQLQDIDAALARIKKGTYGRCQQKDCRGYVRKERLKIYPEAKYCMKCLPANAKHVKS